MPEIGSVNGDPREYRKRLGTFVADQGVALEYSEEIAPARGESSGGKIRLLPGQSPAEEFATLAHEVAHEMMHRHERRSTTQRVRETEAESAWKRRQPRKAISACAVAMPSFSAKASNTSTATQILSAIGTDNSSAPPARRWLPCHGALCLTVKLRHRQDRDIR